MKNKLLMETKMFCNKKAKHFFETVALFGSKAEQLNSNKIRVTQVDPSTTLVPTLKIGRPNAKHLQWPRKFAWPCRLDNDTSGTWQVPLVNHRPEFEARHSTESVHKGPKTTGDLQTLTHQNQKPPTVWPEVARKLCLERLFLDKLQINK